MSKIKANKAQKQLIIFLNKIYKTKKEPDQ